MNTFSGMFIDSDFEFYLLTTKFGQVWTLTIRLHFYLTLSSQFSQFASNLTDANPLIFNDSCASIVRPFDSPTHFQKAPKIHIMIISSSLPPPPLLHKKQSRTTDDATQLSNHRSRFIQRALCHKDSTHSRPGYSERHNHKDFLRLL